MGAKKFQKKFGQTPVLSKTFFWRLLGPDDTQSDQSQKNIFTKQTSMKFLTNEHFPIFLFSIILSPREKVRKMPKFENVTTLSWLTRDNSQILTEPL